jgi:hypothetical protein
MQLSQLASRAAIEFDNRSLGKDVGPTAGSARELAGHLRSQAELRDPTMAVVIYQAFRAAHLEAPSTVDLLVSETEKLIALMEQEAPSIPELHKLRAFCVALSLEAGRRKGW